MHTEIEISRTETSWHAPKPDLWQLYKYRTEYSPLPLVATEGPLHLIRYANPAFCSLVGKEPEEMEGVPYAVAVPEGEGNECLALLDRVFTTGVTASIADQLHAQDSETPHYWSYSVWAVLEEDRCPPGVMIQVTDMSEEKRIHERRSAIGQALMLFSVKQHEFAEMAGEAKRRLELSIREAEHRGKNSLQSISSLLNIQLRATPEAVPVLEVAKIQMHIKTIAAMHDLLVNVAGDISKVQLVPVNKMLQRLLPMWQEIVGEKEIVWKFDEVLLPVRQGKSLSTIINELVCNSVKHGADTVALRLLRAGQTVTLEVSDDGPGFPKDFKLDDSKSFGLHFVENVSRLELGAETSYENRPEGGARDKITFSLPVLGLSPALSLA